MGLYDTVRYATGTDENGRYEWSEAQLKCWNGGEDFKSYTIGDIVPQVQPGISTYYIALREGGFLHIENNKISRWVNKLDIPIVFDKWGMLFDHLTETTENGLLAEENYKFKKSV